MEDPTLAERIVAAASERAKTVAEEQAKEKEEAERRKREEAVAQAGLPGEAQAAAVLGEILPGASSLVGAEGAAAGRASAEPGGIIDMLEQHHAERQREEPSQGGGMEEAAGEDAGTEGAGTEEAGTDAAEDAADEEPEKPEG
jgi:hypothetical protein